jgi:hypothetical protein
MVLTQGQVSKVSFPEQGTHPGSDSRDYMWQDSERIIRAHHGNTETIPEKSEEEEAFHSRPFPHRNQRRHAHRSSSEELADRFSEAGVLHL